MTTQTELLREALKEAFMEGYTRRSTYNDIEVSDVEEEWEKAKPSLLALSQPEQPAPQRTREREIAVMDKQLQQAKELAALKADIAEHVRITAEQATELEAIKAENEPRRKDAERLEALAATPSIVQKVGDRWYSRHEGGFRKQDGLRQAIDAAMQTKEAS